MKKKLVTHNGSFHADDIFACATLTLVLEKAGEEFEVIRTRDPQIIESGDYVFDVGGMYDPAKNRFDHHQAEGAGRRSRSDSEGKDGIEYASIGIVWKKFGPVLCGSQQAADIIDKKLIASIDAGDNGVSLVELKTEVMPYFIQSAFGSFNPGWKNANDENFFLGFIECVKIAKQILNNEISNAQDVVEAEEAVATIYNTTEDKRILVLDKKYPWYDLVQNYPEPLFIVYPRVDKKWGVEGVSASKFSFDKRKFLPAPWAGLRDEELQKVTGVEDAVFCHRGLFLAVAQTKEGAIKLAQIALES